MDIMEQALPHVVTSVSQVVHAFAELEHGEILFGPRKHLPQHFHFAICNATTADPGYLDAGPQGLT